MKIGFVGLGKLGAPCAVAFALADHDVMGYDIDPTLMSKAPRNFLEKGPDGRGNFNDYLAESTLRFGTLEEVAAHSDVIYVAVQTPHDPRFEGITPLPDERKDFDYSHLEAAVASLAKVIKRETIVAIISTVLPGTIRGRILPLCNDHMRVVYTPSFIAMGTTMWDFFHPEFVLMGSDDEEAMETLKGAYGPSVAFAPMNLESAELTKVGYNTFIGLKIVFANTMMEVAHKVPGCNVDQVTEALSRAVNRIISPKYLSGGMGDGGGCHPRDNIALSWLADCKHLSFDLFEAVMQGREDQTEWIARLAFQSMVDHRMPIVIMGYAYKPETNITTGSPALLLEHQLRKMTKNVRLYDHHVDHNSPTPVEPHVFIIGCKHGSYRFHRFPKGSVVIDPWRYIPKQEGVEVIHLGIGPEPQRVARRAAA